MKQASSATEVAKVRDTLAALGEGVATESVRAFSEMGQMGKWGLLQVLGLVGGAEAAAWQRELLEQPRWRSRSGLVCLASLGLRQAQGQEVLKDLARQKGPKESWARICGLLGLSCLPGPLDLPGSPVDLAQPGKAGALELAAALLLVGRRGSPALAQSSLAQAWPREARTWQERLVRRACALALARQPLPNWEEVLLEWLRDEGSRLEDRAAAALGLGALGSQPSRPGFAGLASPRSWAGYLALASLTGARDQVRTWAESRVRQNLPDPLLMAAFAGAYARCLGGDELLDRAGSFSGPPQVREVLLIELALELLATEREELLRRASIRPWVAGKGAEDLILAALAARGAAPERAEVPQGPGLAAKALRGEVPLEVVRSEVARARAAAGAEPDDLLVQTEEELALQILMGPSDFYRRKAPELAPGRAEADLPQGSFPADSPFFEQLWDFLAVLPLYRPLRP